MTHILDHEDGITLEGASAKDAEGTVTFLTNTSYMHGRLLPQIYWAWDIAGSAHVIGPSVQYVISNHWDVKVGANIIWGKETKYAAFGAFKDWDEFYTKLQFSF